MHYTADGRHVADVRFGAKDMTCPAFGGPGADVLYVASAAVRPNRAEDDMGGHLFKYHAGVKGLPKYRFKG
jgi:sugar lactone lactonase YvrE